MHSSSISHHRDHLSHSKHVGHSRSSELSRANFFSKVMGYTGMALLVTALGAYIATFLPESIVMGPAKFIIFIAELALIFTSSKWAQMKRPTNVLLFALFALLSGITIYPLLLVTISIGGVAMIIKALLVTVTLAFAAGIYAKSTHRDLTRFTSFFMMGIIGLIIIGLFQIFWPSNTVEIYASGFGVVLFSGLIAHDIQKINHYPENMPIEAAISLYLSIFNLFIMILRLLISLSVASQE